MQCAWCGKETPDTSAYCESCGHVLENAGSSTDAPPTTATEGTVGPKHAGARHAARAKGDANPTPSAGDAEALAGKAEPAAAQDEPFNEFPDRPWYDPSGANVDAIKRSIRDGSLVDPPSPPAQPKLSRGRIAIIAVIAILFSAAVILLAWALVMRVLGL